MARPLRSGIRRHFLALAVLVLYFLLVMASFSGGSGANSKLSVLWTLLGAAVAYGLGYALYPAAERVMANLSGRPVRKDPSRHSRR